MGYFDGLTDASFKKNKSGETVFYPWGVFGKGRVLTDSVKANELRNFVRRYYQITLPVIIVLAVVRVWLVLLVVTPLFIVWFHVKSRALIADAPISDERLTLKEGYANSAASHSKGTLWLLFLLSGAFVALAVWVALKGRSPDHVAVGVLGSAFFGACGAAIGYMLKVRRVQPRVEVDRPDKPA